ncbi:hypothetical protein BS78_01G199200 [Paspalum vaginatum]|nr:hypothetical protein BS78_01G199200 [Paspalum vaginatum]
MDLVMFGLVRRLLSCTSRHAALLRLEVAPAMEDVLPLPPPPPFLRLSLLRAQGGRAAMARWPSASSCPSSATTQVRPRDHLQRGARAPPDHRRLSRVPRRRAHLPLAPARASSARARWLPPPPSPVRLHPPPPFSRLRLRPPALPSSSHRAPSSSASLRVPRLLWHAAACLAPSHRAPSALHVYTTAWRTGGRTRQAGRHRGEAGQRCYQPGGAMRPTGGQARRTANRRWGAASPVALRRSASKSVLPRSPSSTEAKPTIG